MRRSSLWSAIQIDGDAFLDGFLGINAFASGESERKRDKWEQDIDKMISDLSKKHTSWIVMKTLSDSGHKITIEPELEQACNSTTFPKSEKDAARKGVETKDCSKAATGDNGGSGLGTDSRITFMPSHWRKTQGGCSLGGAGRDGDEILFHEICHAMRYATGQRNACYESVIGFGDYEEFVAITVTNVFSSETQRVLRKDHEGFVVLPPTSNLYNKAGKKVAVNLNDDQLYADFFRPQMNNINTYQPDLVKKLKGLHWVGWNPFYYL